MSLEYFGNDKYKVLSCMAGCQVIIKGKSIVKLSQQEIADLVQLSKVKVNSIIADLKAHDKFTGDYDETISTMNELSNMLYIRQKEYWVPSINDEN